ncbi:hypothetical protein ACFQL8_10420 [Streptomyces goshikiensis]|uniref:hypothetical protein n=1 Tax=Actinomycetes TaxID=1760 RepID=UPI00093C50AD|nr:hypothetical protein [Streptomyces goshikiensis]OKI37303.1 hypothetical protein A6A28_32350 [Streptomyces sp. CB03578]GHD82199.1 hypothetical protein GCM10010336_69300 [Streptomyces goshikiensis]
MGSIIQHGTAEREEGPSRAATALVLLAVGFLAGIYVTDPVAFTSTVEMFASSVYDGAIQWGVTVVLTAVASWCVGRKHTNR